MERDYQEMKAEVGLDHYEGRTWRWLHNHPLLCAVAHGFLVLQRERWQRQQKVEAETAQAPPKRSKQLEFKQGRPLVGDAVAFVNVATGVGAARDPAGGIEQIVQASRPLRSAATLR